MGSWALVKILPLCLGHNYYIRPSVVKHQHISYPSYCGKLLLNILPIAVVIYAENSLDEFSIVIETQIGKLITNSIAIFILEK